ncbi:uncharacterized protein BO88DRAFT_457607 [Aspergillus vadensis CBS 113365]|uniref:Uncharacterized protein n=1 Tax=Aspergillus vadensis (strain CBS 113365 / IMI 142717 / IBT 24658) TaxID=1448311 RepID=A0A319C8P5_ASPVC|nr:hypothetical protein BO88DRAFT_457607 [Aspergillus vadensis CBS 113365]PYH65102.1 hypothetical protein BO88DRAFT_457607 [Aspergillus vadensis CBS 113365]
MAASSTPTRRRITILIVPLRVAVPTLNINVYSPEDHVAIEKATVAVQQAQEEDPKIGLFANFNGSVAVSMFHRDHTAEPPKAFELFHNLRSLVTTVLPSTSGTPPSFSQALGEVGHA